MKDVKIWLFEGAAPDSPDIAGRREPKPRGNKKRGFELPNGTFVLFNGDGEPEFMEEAPRGMRMVVPFWVSDADIQKLMDFVKLTGEAPTIATRIFMDISAREIVPEEQVAAQI